VVAGRGYTDTRLPRRASGCIMLHCQPAYRIALPMPTSPCTPTLVTLRYTFAVQEQRHPAAPRCDAEVLWSACRKFGALGVFPLYGRRPATRSCADMDISQPARRGNCVGDESRPQMLHNDSSEGKRSGSTSVPKLLR
jgi:hypothetical protein